MKIGELRKRILAGLGVEKVRIKRNGEVHVWGDMPRSDVASKRKWWQYVGDTKSLSTLFDAEA